MGEGEVNCSDPGLETLHRSRLMLLPLMVGGRSIHGWSLGRKTAVCSWFCWRGGGMRTSGTVWYALIVSGLRDGWYGVLMETSPWWYL